jgi:hypothetical protein
LQHFHFTHSTRGIRGDQPQTAGGDSRGSQNRKDVLNPPFRLCDFILAWILTPDSLSKDHTLKVLDFEEFLDHSTCRIEICNCAGDRATEAKPSGKPLHYGFRSFEGRPRSRGVVTCEAPHLILVFLRVTLVAFRVSSHARAT